MEFKEAKELVEQLKENLCILAVCDINMEAVSGKPCGYKSARVGLLMYLVKTPNGLEYREATTKERHLVYVKTAYSARRMETLAIQIAKRFNGVITRAVGIKAVDSLLRQTYRQDIKYFTSINPKNKVSILDVLPKVVHSYLGVNNETLTPEQARKKEVEAVLQQLEKQDKRDKNPSKQTESKVQQKGSLSEAVVHPKEPLEQMTDTTAYTESTLADSSRSVQETEQSVQETEQSVQETEQSVQETEQSDISDERSVTETAESLDIQQKQTDYERPIDTPAPTTSDLMKQVGVEKLVENCTVCGKTDAEINELQYAAREAGYGCKACNYTGWQFTTMGLRVKCSCQDKAKYKREEVKPKLDIQAICKDGELAVINQLIPEERRFDDFDAEYARRQAAMVGRTCGCTIIDFDQSYIPTLLEVMGKLLTGKLDTSYIIGAPNGFGKTTFVMTCIKRLANMNRKVVPYKSLRELAELQEEEATRVLRRTYAARKKKDPDAGELATSKPKFTWRDYMESDVLFTFLTSAENRLIESSTLKGILEERGVWHRPTIVMTSSSLKLYTNDRALKQTFWDDMLAYGGITGSCDRLVHKSCYKRYKSVITVKEGEDY